MRSILLCLGICGAFVSNASAVCNIPVFRYALERWQPDACRVVVFYEGAFTAEQESVVDRWGSQGIAAGGSTNLELIRYDLRTKTDLKLQESWESLNRPERRGLPFLSVQSSLGNGKVVPVWNGPLRAEPIPTVVDSPVRKELSKRLLEGDAVVWIMLKSNDNVRNNLSYNLLKQELSRLESKLKLPDGIGLPGSELYSDVPLLLKFSILELNPMDKDEELLVSLFRSFEPELVDEPLFIPVFGRGRALEVMTGKQMDAALIESLTMFLCGACSCQVKERNPGFDLLLSVNWNRELFGEDGDVPPPVTSLERAPTNPKLLQVPPGRIRPTSSPPGAGR